MSRESDIQLLVEQNRERMEAMFGPYDPVTGIGCYDFEHRVKVCIPDCVIPEMYVPKECMDVLLFRQLVQYGSIAKLITEGLKKPHTIEMESLVNFEICKVRFREDPEFALYMEDKIEDKATGNLIPFRLNYPQRKLLHIFERQRHKKKA